MKQKLFFVLAILLILSLLYVRLTPSLTLASSSKATSHEWEDIIIEPGKDLEFILDEADFPSGSNFPAGNAIEFYLGKLGTVNQDKAEFYGFSGVQGFWDQEAFRVQYWKTNYDQDLSGEQILERHFEMLANSGIKWVRMDWIWFWVYRRGTIDQCQQDAKYDFSKTDNIFRLARKHDLNILANLGTTPSYVSACEVREGSGYRQCNWGEGGQYRPPMDLYVNNCVGHGSNRCQGLRSEGSPCFNEFFRRSLERYQPGGTYYDDYPDSDKSYGITHWEVWNEQDWKFWCTPDEGGCHQRATYKPYLHLLKGSYDVIDGVRNSSGTDLKLVFGGLALPDCAPGGGVDCSSTSWSNTRLNKYYEDFTSEYGKNLNNYYDILSVHRYASGRIKKVLSLSREVLDHYGGQNKLIWLTETGGVEKRGSEGPQAAWFIDNLIPLYNTRGLYKLEKVFWWPGKDYYLTAGNHNRYLNGQIGDRTAIGGVIKNYYSPKEVYYRIAQEIHIAGWEKYRKNLGTNNAVTLIIPTAHLQENKSYSLFWVVDKKLSVGRTIKITVSDTAVSPTPSPSPTSPPPSATLPPPSSTPPPLSPSPSHTPPPGATLTFSFKPEGMVNPPSLLGTGVETIIDGQGTPQDITASYLTDGEYEGEISGLDPGTYTIIVKPERHLSEKFEGISITEGNNEYDFTKTQYEAKFLAGDVSGADGSSNNKMDIYDIALVGTALDEEGDPTDLEADVDYDGRVSILDLTYVLVNFDEEGEIAD